MVEADLRSTRVRTATLRRALRQGRPSGRDEQPLDRLFDLSGKRIWVAGHRGMVGAPWCAGWGARTAPCSTASRQDCDLIRQDQVEAWLERARPDVVVVAAAKVGGILANDSYPAEFLYDNLMIEANVIDAAHRVGVAKLLFLGSSAASTRASPPSRWPRTAC